MRVYAGLHGVQLGFFLGDLKEICLFNIMLQFITHPVKAVGDLGKFIIIVRYREPVVQVILAYQVHPFLYCLDFFVCDPQCYHIQQYRSRTDDDGKHCQDHLGEASCDSSRRQLVIGKKFIVPIINGSKVIAFSVQHSADNGHLDGRRAGGNLLSSQDPLCILIVPVRREENIPVSVSKCKSS